MPLLLSVILTTLIAFTSTFAAGAANEKKVRLAYFESTNFLEGADDGSVKSGFAYEILHQISNYTGWKYEYVYGDWATLFEQFKEGKIDLFPGLAKRDDRASFMDWPNYPIDTDFHSLFIRKGDSTFVENNWASINGRRIGLIRNNNMTDEFLSWAQKKGLQPIEVYYDDIDELVEELIAKKIDAMVGSDNNIDDSKPVKIFAPIAQAESYIAVRKNAGNILNELNGALASIEQETPYFIKDLKRKHFSNNIANTTLSREEEKQLDEHKIVKVGYTDNYLPFSGTDADGNPSGVILDIVGRLTSNLKIDHHVTVEYVKHDTYNKMLEALTAGEIDVAFPVMKSVWHAEQSGIIETQPLVFSAISAVFKGNFHISKFDKISVNKNATLQEVFLKEHFPHSQVVWCDSQENCLDEVEKGISGITLYNSTRIREALSKKHESLSEMSVGTAVGFSLGVRKGNTTLAKLLNRGVNLLDIDELSQIMFKYVENPDDEIVKIFFKENALKILFSVLVLGSLVFFIIILLLKKTKQAEANTANLNKSLQETNDIIANANMGVWHITLFDGEKPRMKANAKMRELLSLPDDVTDETEIYEAWHSRIKPEALPSVNASVEAMMMGVRNENTYLWIDPKLGEQYVRCGGVAEHVKGKGWILRGYHYNVNEEVLRDQKRELQLAQALKESEKSDKAKTSFLFNMSHDIRTPMNAIIGFTNLLAKEIKDNDKAADYVKKIQNSNGFLLSIINDVLEMSRIESGNETLRETPTLSSNIAEELTDFFEEQMKEKDIRFTAEIELKHRNISLDEAKVRKIFMNILGNAQKYTSQGGSVNLEIKELPSEKPGYINIQTTVSDTGIGISEEFLPHIYEAFAREHTSTENKVSGTGLGLSIVKKLVELMNGTIEVESYQGKGTKVIVTLPHRLVNANLNDKTEPKPQPAKVDFTGKRILLAEDNELNAEIAITVLEEQGFKIEHAADGQICVDMLAAAQTGYYDLILMDIQMPHLNGYEATRAIREMADSVKASIAIIAMTANAFDEDKKAAIAAGMNGHIAKPIDVDNLMKCLAEVIG